MVAVWGRWYHDHKTALKGVMGEIVAVRDGEEMKKGGFLHFKYVKSSDYAWELFGSWRPSFLMLTVWPRQWVTHHVAAWPHCFTCLIRWLLLPRRQKWQGRSSLSWCPVESRLALEWPRHFKWGLEMDINKMNNTYPISQLSKAIAQNNKHFSTVFSDWLIKYTLDFDIDGCQDSKNILTRGYQLGKA